MWNLSADAVSPNAGCTRSRAPRRSVQAVGRVLSRALLVPILLCPLAAIAAAQGDPRHTLYGDFKVDENGAVGAVPKVFNVILKGRMGNTVARQQVSNNSRFSFPAVSNGEYDLVVEMESEEVARVHVVLNQSISTDIRQDISLEWRGRPSANKSGTVSASDLYHRSAPNQALYEKALAATKKKDYEQAVSLLHQVVESDPKDFVAWTELGTQRFNQGNNGEAEKAFQRALQESPSYILALLNMGKLRFTQKNFEGAIEPLDKAVRQQPDSAEANLLLGECYLQIKKGSKAVPYLNEAARLGRPEAHLRLATLYNAAGMKDRAAAEYEKFLSKKPDHPDRKKLEQYIKENKKQ
jgi:Tfp pilus assembly protein PilF